MGYGLGAAIGAQTANPDRTVVNIAGDGCFRMNMNELATASREKLPLIEVIINNHVLGMVRQWQKLFYGKRYAMTNLRAGALSRRTEGMEYPQYTRPEVWHDREVPKVLLSGNHAEIAKWRREEAVKATYLKRPELLERSPLTEKDLAIIHKLEEKEDKK